VKPNKLVLAVLAVLLIVGVVAGIRGMTWFVQGVIGTTE
jgi:hypothetical protein